jgi:23S rRNA pseudouridine1911/1915/1917 synthase
MNSPPFEILYEDNHLIAVNKPSGLLSQSTKDEEDSLENGLKQWLKERDKKPGNVFLGVIHRLDKPASGIVLFAKTSKALSRLNQVMRDKEFKKTYYALVEGSVENDEAILKHFLRHDDHRAHVSHREDKDAKEACLHYTVIRRDQTTSLLQIDLKTGRYHQIRAQCAAIGHPIVGDTKYGSHISYESGQIALHHGCLEFCHPVTKKALRIEARRDNIFANRG